MHRETCIFFEPFLFLNFIFSSLNLAFEMNKFQGFDLLWLQSTPSIAAIFYQKYLKNTHVLYCPDDVDNYISQQQPRQIAKHILYVMSSVRRFSQRSRE